MTKLGLNLAVRRAFYEILEFLLYVMENVSKIWSLCIPHSFRIYFKRRWTMRYNHHISMSKEIQSSCLFRNSLAIGFG